MAKQSLILRTGRYMIEVHRHVVRNAARYATLVRYQHRDGKVDRLDFLPWDTDDMPTPADRVHLDRRDAWSHATEIAWRLAEHQERCHG
jgi:hypothetical protein